MKIINPIPTDGRPLRLRETRAEYRVRLRAPLKGPGVVTRRRVLTGKTLRPKHRLTEGVFQRRGGGPMKAQALVFPKPQTAATARRKASKLTGRKVNPCLPPEGSGMPGEESVEVMVNPRKRIPRGTRSELTGSFVEELAREVESEGFRSRAHAYKAGVLNGLVAVGRALQKAPARKPASLYGLSQDVDRVATLYKGAARL